LNCFVLNEMNRSTIKLLIYYNTKWALVQTYIGAHFVKNLKIHLISTVSHFFLEQIFFGVFQNSAQHFSTVL
jgi:hypothetical protein